MALLQYGLPQVSSVCFSEKKWAGWLIKKFGPSAECKKSDLAFNGIQC